MNYINGDYLLGHILKRARKTGLNKLTVDILKGNAEPRKLLTSSISASLDYYYRWFPTLVEGCGSTMDYVASATMTIEFDLKTSRPYPSNNFYTENPFVCEIIIIDDRGKEYKHTHSGWWFPESSFLDKIGG